MLGLYNGGVLTTVLLQAYLYRKSRLKRFFLPRVAIFGISVNFGDMVGSLAAYFDHS